MIKRLKRRFIIVNISILTCVLISILVSIFLMMYSSEVNLSYELMESLINQRSFETNDPIPEEYVSEIINENMSLLNNFYENENEDEHFNEWDNRENNINDIPRYPNDNNISPEPNEPPPKPSEYIQLPSPAVTQKPYNEEKTQPTEAAAAKETVPKSTDSMINEKQEVVSEKNIIDNKQTENSQTKTVTQKSDINNKNRTDKSKNSPETSISTINSTSNTTSSSIITDISTEIILKPDKKPNKDDKPREKNEPDPFKGKVKRSNIYIEFKDLNDIENIVYQYCTSENDTDVKAAVKEIFNDKKEYGKINIGSDKYRYIFRYDPPKMKYCIIMLDRTLEINTISRLLFFFIIIAGAGLVFICFISVLLANWTIKPVVKSWNQQKEFIANASHELKTPLTVISTNTDLVLSYPDDFVKNQSKWLNYIKNETIRMSKLVNNLLNIAKYDANKIQLIYNKINFSNLLSSICLQYEPLVFENHKTLITDIDNNLEIVGDEDKIKQVINILMDNALKYSLSGGTIKVSLKKIKQSSVCMTISNPSENISKKQLEKIFDRFYRIDDSRNRKTGGSGLGLNIAKTIIESHKGTINAVNNDNITSFIIIL